MHQQKWVPRNGHPHQEVVVNDLATCAGLVILVGARGAAAVHISPMPNHWQREVAHTVRLAAAHHRAGDRYEVHFIQGDPRSDRPSQHAQHHRLDMADPAARAKWSKSQDWLQQGFEQGYEMRKSVHDLVARELRGGPGGSAPKIHKHWYWSE